MKVSRIRIGVLIALATAVSLAAVADAKTYRVSGRQIAVNANKGKYKMRGGLRGRWQVTSFKRLATTPLFRAKGTELFRGCLDVRHDGHCSGDPKGNLRFKFRYWADFASDGSLVWGSCWHPITGGTGDFAGAQGVLTMVDTPTRHGATTHWTGNVTLGAVSKARRAATPAGCG
jgi:hypothetical protein